MHTYPVILLIALHENELCTNADTNSNPSPNPAQLTSHPDRNPNVNGRYIEFLQLHYLYVKPQNHPLLPKMYSMEYTHVSNNLSYKERKQKPARNILLQSIPPCMRVSVHYQS